MQSLPTPWYADTYPDMHVCGPIYILVPRYVNVQCSVQIVSYPDPYVRNDDHRLQYDITYRGSGNEVVRNGSWNVHCYIIVVSSQIPTYVTDSKSIMDCRTSV